MEIAKSYKNLQILNKKAMKIFSTKHLNSDGFGRDIKATIDCKVFNKCFDEKLCIHLIQMK